MRIVEFEGSAHTCRFSIADVRPIQEAQEVCDEGKREDHSIKLPPHASFCRLIDLASQWPGFRVSDRSLLGILILLHVILDGSDSMAFRHVAQGVRKTVM